MHLCLSSTRFVVILVLFLVPRFPSPCLLCSLCFSFSLLLFNRLLLWSLEEEEDVSEEEQQKNEEAQENGRRRRRGEV